MAVDYSSHVILQTGKLRPGKGECLIGGGPLYLALVLLEHLQRQQMGGGGSGSRQK